MSSWENSFWFIYQLLLIFICHGLDHFWGKEFFFVKNLVEFSSANFRENQLIKCSCMKSLQKYGLMMPIKLPDDIAAHDLKKTKKWFCSSKTDKIHIQESFRFSTIVWNHVTNWLGSTSRWGYLTVLFWYWDHLWHNFHFKEV